jgi:hypothetical protein
MFRIRKRAATLVAAAAASGLLLAACGGDVGAVDGSAVGDQKPTSSAQKEQKSDGMNDALVQSVDFSNPPIPVQDSSAMALVNASIPEFNFTGPLGNDPCWPEDAFDSDGTPHDGGNVADWPHAGDTCAGKGSPHPTYFSVRQCEADRVRVSFTLYYATSGFEPDGHPHDFEHVDVEWRLNEGWTEWQRSQLLLSQHGEHEIRPWAEAESWNADRGSAGLGRMFPRIFVGFGSHAMYNDQKGQQDLGSSLSTHLEYRAADYQSWADTNDLVRVAPGDPNGLYEKFTEHSANEAWGGTEDPANVYDTMCTHDEKGKGDGT